MTSTFGAAFDKLPRDVQVGITTSLLARKKQYSRGLTGFRSDEVRVIVVGDTPGPAASKLPAGHHHTPFYSTKNSSLWLNRQLVEAGIDENRTFWINAWSIDGSPAHPSHLSQWSSLQMVALLGGNAEKWFDKYARGVVPVFVDVVKFQHPQAWKRFRSKEPYPLIGALKQHCSTCKTPD